MLVNMEKKKANIFFSWYKRTKKKKQEGCIGQSRNHRNTNVFVLIKCQELLCEIKYLKSLLKYLDFRVNLFLNGWTIHLWTKSKQNHTTIFIFISLQTIRYTFSHRRTKKLFFFGLVSDSISTLTFLKKEGEFITPTFFDN